MRKYKKDKTKGNLLFKLRQRASGSGLVRGTCLKDERLLKI